MLRPFVREEMVRCGKKGCKSCPHGPYRYEYYYLSGKLKKRYLGKAAKNVTPATALDRLLRGDPVSDQDCARVLGLEGVQSFTKMRQAYRKIVREFCPHSGHYDERRYKAIRAAWNRLRGFRR